LATEYDPPQTGTDKPQLETKLLDVAHISLNDLKGKVVDDEAERVRQEMLRDPGHTDWFIP